MTTKPVMDEAKGVEDDGPEEGEIEDDEIEPVQTSSSDRKDNVFPASRRRQDNVFSAARRRNINNSRTLQQLVENKRLPAFRTFPRKDQYVNKPAQGLLKQSLRTKEFVGKNEKANDYRIMLNEYKEACKRGRVAVVGSEGKNRHPIKGYCEPRVKHPTTSAAEKPKSRKRKHVHLKVLEVSNIMSVSSMAENCVDSPSKRQKKNASERKLKYHDKKKKRVHVEPHKKKQKVSEKERRSEDVNAVKIFSEIRQNAKQEVCSLKNEIRTSTVKNYKEDDDCIIIDEDEGGTSKPEDGDEKENESIVASDSYVKSKSVTSDDKSEGVHREVEVEIDNAISGSTNISEMPLSQPSQSTSEHDNHGTSDATCSDNGKEPECDVGSCVDGGKVAKKSEEEEEELRLRLLALASAVKRKVPKLKAKKTAMKAKLQSRKDDLHINPEEVLEAVMICSEGNGEILSDSLDNANGNFRDGIEDKIRNSIQIIEGKGDCTNTSQDPCVNVELPPQDADHPPLPPLPPPPPPPPEEEHSGIQQRNEDLGPDGPASPIDMDLASTDENSEDELTTTDQGSEFWNNITSASLYELIWDPYATESGESEFFQDENGHCTENSADNFVQDEDTSNADSTESNPKPISVRISANQINNQNMNIPSIVSGFAPAPTQQERVCLRNIDLHDSTDVMFATVFSDDCHKQTNVPDSHVDDNQNRPLLLDVGIENEFEDGQMIVLDEIGHCSSPEVLQEDGHVVENHEEEAEKNDGAAKENESEDEDLLRETLLRDLARKQAGSVPERKLADRPSRVVVKNSTNTVASIKPKLSSLSTIPSKLLISQQKAKLVTKLSRYQYTRHLLHKQLPEKYKIISSHHLDKRRTLVKIPPVSQQTRKVVRSNSRVKLQVTVPTSSIPVNTAKILKPKEEPRKNEQKRIVINLGEDSDDSDDDGLDPKPVANVEKVVNSVYGDCGKLVPSESSVKESRLQDLEKEVDLLLQRSRKEVEKHQQRVVKASPKSGTLQTPVAVRHLPHSQQEEYRRLKIEIARREKLKLHKTRSTSSPSRPTSKHKDCMQGTMLSEVQVPMSQPTMTATANETVSLISSTGGGRIRKNVTTENARQNVSSSEDCSDKISGFREHSLNSAAIPLDILHLVPEQLATVSDASQNCDNEIAQQILVESPKTRQETSAQCDEGGQALSESNSDNPCLSVMQDNSPAITADDSSEDEASLRERLLLSRQKKEKPAMSKRPEVKTSGGVVTSSSEIASGVVLSCNNNKKEQHFQQGENDALKSDKNLSSQSATMFNQDQDEKMEKKTVAKIGPVADRTVRLDLEGLELQVLSERHTMLDILQDITTHLTKMEEEKNELDKAELEVKLLEENLKKAQQRLKIKKVCISRLTQHVGKSRLEVLSSQERFKNLTDQCLKLGNKINGPGYKLPCRGAELVKVKVQEVADRTKRLNKFKKTETPSLTRELNDNEGKDTSLTKPVESQVPRKATLNTTSAVQNKLIALATPVPDPINVPGSSFCSLRDIVAMNTRRPKNKKKKRRNRFPKATYFSGNHRQFFPSTTHRHVRGTVVQKHRNTQLLSRHIERCDVQAMNMDTPDVEVIEGGLPERSLTLGDYTSPLQHFYDSRSSCKEENKLPWVDPHVILCPYELTGVCNDDDCKYQHQRCNENL